jgi:hypothetical protein
MIRALVFAVALSGIAAPVLAQGLAVDPNRPVRGSCGEILQPLFAAAREAMATPDGAIAKFDVEVTRTESAADAAPIVSSRVLDSRHMAPAAVATLQQAFERAYLAPQQEGCIGVITRRNRWIMRMGPAEAMWLPDDPVVINRAVAAATTAGGQRIEMIDPMLGRSRLAVRATENDARSCHREPPWQVRRRPG